MNRVLFVFIGLLTWQISQAFANSDGLSLLKKADSLFSVSNYSGAHRVYLEALQVSETTQNCRVKVLANRGIGACYYYLYEKKNALKWFKAYVNAINVCRADSMLYDAYYLVNVLYIEEGNVDSVSKYSERAISYMKKGKKYSNLSQIYATLAEFHIQTSKKQAEIVKFLKLAETYALEAKDTGMLAFTKMKQFNYHFYYTKNYREALQFINQAEYLYLIIGNTEATTNAYRAKAECLAMLGDTLAASYMNKWFNYKDSVFDIEKANGIALYETQFETKKKEEQLRLQQEKLKREKQLRVFYILISALLIALLVLVGMLKLQRNRQKTAQLIQEQNERRIREIFAAEQSERIRIARDLHDSIGQKLAVIKMLAPDNFEESGKFSQYLDEATTDIREICHNLIPEILRFGIDKALQALVDSINSTEQIKVVYTAGNQYHTLDSQTELSVYRLVQELLGNMIKHSGASEIFISMTSSANLITLGLRDNGRGFDTDQIGLSKGIGWNNIFARVKIINGDIKMHSKPNEGSVFTINIPLAS